MKKEIGFSLVETLVVLSILSIVVGVASLGLLSPGVKSNANRLMHLLDVYAQVARHAGENVSVRFEGNRAEIFLGDSKRELFQLSNGVEISDYRFGNLQDRSLILRGNGTTTPGRLTLSSRFGGNCTLYQALRGARRLSCSE